jgi:nicotinamidase/pyrazinamidase
LLRKFDCLKEEIILTKTDALIVTDMQNDFLPGGALPVPEGDQILLAINDYIGIFSKANLPIFATRDWHPPNHTSFKQQGGPWPPHCVQNTEGAQFSPLLKLPKDSTIISKATNPAKEAYSSFEGTDLAVKLKAMRISRIFVGGLATDYCVRNTAIDGLRKGLKVVVLSDAIRGINVNPGDSENAVQEMLQHGAMQAELEDFPDPASTLAPMPGSEQVADEPLNRAEIKKRTRMRSRGPYRKVRAER